MDNDAFKSLVGEVLQFLSLSPDLFLLLVFFIFNALPPFLLLLAKMLLSLLVKFCHGFKVVIRSAVTLDVDAHGFKHLKVLSVAVYLEKLGLILLEEAREWELSSRSEILDRVKLLPERVASFLLIRNPMSLLEVSYKLANSLVNQVS